MVSFDEEEQVKKKLFIAISFDSYWTLIKNQSPGHRLISLPSLAQTEKTSFFFLLS